MRQKHQNTEPNDSLQKSTKPSKEKNTNTPQIVLQNRHWRNVSKFFVWNKYYHKKKTDKDTPQKKKLQASISDEYRKGSG